MSNSGFNDANEAVGHERIRSLAKVFNIAPGSPFLDVLVAALCDGRIFDGFRPADNPLLLPEVTIYVPNRRAARALSVAFVEASSGDAQLLPAIKTLGDVGDDEFGIASSLDESGTLPNAVGPLERKLELSTLVQKWVDAMSAETRRLYGDEEIFIPSSQADAVRLSADLCKLLDEITQEESGWRKIKDVVPEEHAQWWSLTSSFLRIIMENWPLSLKSRGLMDPAQHSLGLLELRIQRYGIEGSKGPVIIAGSTGSVPSTRRFLEVVSKLPNGAVVLPGFDANMDAGEWKALDPDQSTTKSPPESHPQFGLATLLRTLGVERRDVVRLDTRSQELEDRSRLVSIALSLPEFSDRWKENVSQFPREAIISAFRDVALIEAINERQEALAIALSLRETLEIEAKTAALVTPDRNLANRVSVELQRFGIEVDDSSGVPLRNTQIGLFVRQLVNTSFGLASKADISALLKSPLMPSNSSLEDARQIGETIELHFLRGTIGMPQPGALSLWANMQFEKHQQHGVSKLSEETREIIKLHCEKIDHALVGLTTLARAGEATTLGLFVSNLSEALMHLCMDDRGCLVCQTANGYPELQQLFEEIQKSGASNHLIDPVDFPSVFEAIIAPVTVRLRTPTHPRLHIYGPLEARLLDYDKIIMAGLNEGTWPGITRNDAFLNRLMRHELGMASPERSTGLAAHDFQELMGKREVVLSRSSRVDKAPTIASRWVQCLLAVIGEPVSTTIRERGNRYLDIAELLDKTGNLPKRATRPCPSPPVDARPQKLPVTDIETWIRDPYALYAKRILGLSALMPLEREPDNLLRGTLYHAIMEDYVSMERFSRDQKARLDELVNLATSHIRAERLPADIETLWLMRFDDIAQKFVQWETEQQTKHPVREIHKEVRGGIEVAGGEFFLHARADRIDVLEDGQLLVMDYKTGGSPTAPQARTLSPQLALEGAIAAAGGFAGIDSAKLADLAFVRLRQGKDFKFETIADKKNSIDEIVGNAKSNLEALIAKFRDPAMGYISRRAPFKQEMMDFDYDHLARTREWSFGEEGDDE